VPAGVDDGWAKVLPLAKGDALFPAALVSLGLLGVVSKVRSFFSPFWFQYFKCTQNNANMPS
jgi:hypothetical protein